MCGSRIIATAMLLMQSAASLQPQRIHLVVNPFGGGGAGLATMEAVLPIFEKAGIEVTTLQTEYAGHAGEYAQTVPLHDAFIGIGGDGTAHEIANGMLRRDEADRVPIGIIPAGSGNTWAFDLGLAGAEDAASIIVNGQTAAVDVMAISAVDQPEASFQAASNPWHFISSGCAASQRSAFACANTAAVSPAGNAWPWSAGGTRVRAQHLRLRHAGGGARAGERAALARQRSRLK